MTFHELNTLPLVELKQQLFACCGSKALVNKMLAFFPMDDLVEMLEDAEEQWYACAEADWKEAVNNEAGVGSTDISTGIVFDATDFKQSGSGFLDSYTVGEFKKATDQYKQKFGYQFVVLTTAERLDETMVNLRERLLHSTYEEIKIAMEEQNKITLFRLQNLIT